MEETVGFFKLRPGQVEAIENMHNGCILCGDVGSGKSRTALAYYYQQMDGNIYADEILFAIRIHPLTPGNCLDEEDMKKLIKQTRQILKRAIKAGGTTIRSYTSSLGVTGRFQLSLSVHTMEKCPLCDSKITKIAVGGRGTYFCEKCQVLKS